MAKKGKGKKQWPYRLKHMDKWTKLMEPKTPQEQFPAKNNPFMAASFNKNTNQLFTWDTLEDVPLKLQQ